MSKRSILIGGGGHGVSLAEAVIRQGYELEGVLDQGMLPGTEILPGLHVLADDELLVDLRREGIVHAFIGLGGATNNEGRRMLYEKAFEAGYNLPPVIHPAASVGPGCELSPAVQILAGASVGPRCRVGVNAIINQGAVVCHGAVIGDHAHVAPGSTLGGDVRVGECSTIGLGATVLFGVTIGANVLVHAGARVLTDIPDGATVRA
ncbi:NeuD/PglB/VioB family sugar acetyltransferase [Magnetospira sp. QH-2]|uniref:NeuD/PglB/VioB family sugar acetyltransferase n=1 Tax=Magnetospira sp. (strain QH-2) TaxID=1288970 RepID=UPI0003E81857|nr:NeuD/PglB/VioB family sugar acetyltransferase [Magnetospira sp. QH-2]CCQ73843.1 Hexapeptide transferase family protein. Putative sialic acid O-acyltransferase, NeuD [Magnetospira sp. QH-2]